MRRASIAIVLVVVACGKRGDRAQTSSRDTVPISITTSLPGASPSVMAESVTTPLERQLGQAARLESLHSRSTEGRSVVIAEFASGTDVDVASQEVQKAINAASPLLPQQLPAPPTYSRASRKGAVMRLTVTGQVLAVEALAGSAREIISTKLSQVAGVGAVEFCGPDDETRITVNLDALATSGKTIEDIRAAIVAAAASHDRAAAPPAFEDVPLLRDTTHIAADASVSSCVARGPHDARVLAVTVTPVVGADPVAVRERLEAAVPTVVTELQAMRVVVWPRTRPLAYEIALGPSLPIEARVRKLEHALADPDLELPSQSLLQLGLPDHEPDVADLRILPPTEHPESVGAKLAAVLERQNVTLLDRTDHIVGLSGPDPAAVRQQTATLVTAIAAAKTVHVVEQIGLDQQPRQVAKIDRDRAAALGITAASIETTLAVLAPGGMRVASTFTPNGEYPVMLVVGWPLADVLARVTVRSTGGALVPLSAVVSVAEVAEADAILHEGQFPWLGVRVAGPIAALNQVLAKLPVPGDIKRDVREPE